jgi:hypothetical protein
VYDKKLLEPNSIFFSNQRKRVLQIYSRHATETGLREKFEEQKIITQAILLKLKKQIYNLKKNGKVSHG